MLIIVDPNNGVPVYRQLVDQVRFQIASGRLQPGDKLPSTRALSLRLGVNPMTISKAYAILEGEGLLDHRPGLPLVVATHAKGNRAGVKLGQLTIALQPAAIAAVQLGISGDKAAAMLRKLIEERTKTAEKSE